MNAIVMMTAYSYDDWLTVAVELVQRGQSAWLRVGSLIPCIGRLHNNIGYNNYHNNNNTLYVNKMNLILSPTKIYLLIDRLLALTMLTFTKLIGRRLTSLKPIDYVKSWFAKFRHSADDTNSRSSDNAIETNDYQLLRKLL